MSQFNETDFSCGLKSFLLKDLTFQLFLSSGYYKTRGYLKAKYVNSD